MGLVGEGALVTGVLPDVFPVIDVENLATDGWALAGWRPAMGGPVITAAAGERPHIQILNPAGSGVITVVEQIMFSTNTTGVVQFNIHDAVLATADTSGRWRDRRFPTLNFPVTQVREESIVGTPIVSAQSCRLLANTTVVWDMPRGFAVLVPGTGIAFSHSAAATQLALNFFWRERTLEPAEENL